MNEKSTTWVVGFQIGKQQRRELKNRRNEDVETQKNFKGEKNISTYIERERMANLSNQKSQKMCGCVKCLGGRRGFL